MLHIDKWATGRPPFLSAFAQSMATFPDMLTGLLNAIISGNFPHKDFPSVPLNEWLGYYKNHRRIWSVITAALVQETVPDLEAIQRVDNFDWQDNSLADYKAFSTQNQAFFKDYYHHNLGRIQDNFQGGNAPVSGQPAAQVFGQDMDNSALLFLLRVWLPCYFLYGTTPPRLLRSAQQGNDKALDRLLRLDKSAIFDPKIACQFHQAAGQQSRQFDRLIDALKRPPKGTIQKRKVKASIAAFICFIFESCGHKLEEPEIRALFDAVAKDQGLGDIDTDIPDGSEAFSRAIRRELPSWRKTLKSDKK